jgi:hypothetical protein
MRERRDIIAVAVLLIAFIALTVLIRARNEEVAGSDPRASTYHASPGGVLALRLLAEEIGMKTRQRVQSLTLGPDPDVRMLTLLAPAEQLTPREVTQLLDWVRDGGTLVYALGQDNRLADSLRLHRRRIVTPRFGTATRTDGEIATASVDRLVADIGVVGSFRFVLVDSGRTTRAAAPRVLASTRRGPAVLSLDLGAGHVIALSDVAPLSNAALRDNGAGVLFARVAQDALRGDGVIEFDEYHQGYHGGGGAWQGLRGFLRTRPGHVTLQLALAGLLLLFVAARRFGAPLEPPPIRRRSPIEHVEALATAYGRAGAHGTARRLLLDGLHRRLGRRVARPRGREVGPPAGIEHSPAGRRLIEEWQRTDDTDLVAFAHAVDDVVAEVRR